MKYILSPVLILSFLFLSIGCSRTGEEEVVGPVTQVSNPLKPISPDGDEDGDRIPNSKDENMFLADVVELDKKIAQSYSMVLDKPVSGSASFTIEHNVDHGDFDFNYGVGNHDFKVKSDRMISKVAKFTSVARGVLRTIDYEKISYPKAKKGRHLKGLREYLAAGYEYDIEGNDLKVSFSSTITLVPTDNFEEIKDVVLGIYYFNYDTGKDVKVATTKVARTFARDNKEKFTVTLENLPNRILLENYFKHGEFLSVKVEDFTIPSMKTTNSEFMKGVYAKTIPVGITTPLYNRVKYVSTSRHNNTIVKIIQAIFREDYKIENNVITQLGEFVNNTKGGETLGDLRGHDKTGKWYLLTNKTKYEVFNHEFKAGDRIIFNFAIDNTVATQVERTSSMIKPKVESGEFYEEFDLGEISKNSKLSLLISGVTLKREDLFKREIPSGGRFFSHRSGNNVYYKAYMCYFREQRRSGNFLVDPLKFDRDDKSENLEHILLVSQDQSFNFKEILEKAEGISHEWVQDTLVFKIHNSEKLFESLQVEPSSLRIRVASIDRPGYVGSKRTHGKGPYTDQRALQCREDIIWGNFPEHRPKHIDHKHEVTVDLIGHLDTFYN